MRQCDKCGATAVRPRARGFRVSVDLSRYFGAQDARARCFVWVPADSSRAAAARPVRWLQARLRAQFELRGALALSAGGHLLPPREPLALLRPGDQLQVIPMDSEDRLEETSNKEDSILEMNIAIENPANRQSETRPVAAPVPPASAALEADEPDAIELQRHKRRALALLERCGAADAPPAPHAPPSPRRGRRRVRRRPRARPALSPSPPSPPPQGSQPSPAPVLRNERFTDSSVTPRLVRALN